MDKFESALPICGDTVTFEEKTTGIVEQCDGSSVLVSVKTGEHVRFVRIQYESISRVSRTGREPQ